ncbi:twin-arginine translocase subunit TatC [Labilibacter marinus]|uniref:twin-arginine translocase subunit TatC n=1 Tax=Labilibacter marinus TaxID=1477105 RepID=UPI00094FB128|nr:twin-arginine translocase subunit TatC [Labilibacter marinus]
MAESEKEEMTFLQHLEELRWHLVRAFVSVFIVAVLAFMYKEILFDVIIFGPSRPDFFTNIKLFELGQMINMPALGINQTKYDFQNILMAGQFTMHLKVSFIAGLVVAFPYIFWEFWRFIKPALYQQEVKHSRGAIFFASVLFSVGVLFAYYVICPLSVHFLANYKVSAIVENDLNLGSYISTITSIVLAGGVIFELPILIYFLAKVGLVTAVTLKKYRRHAIIVSLLLAAIITPPDIISQVLVCFPLIFLYEGGILIARNIERKKLKEQMQ